MGAGDSKGSESQSGLRFVLSGFSESERQSLTVTYKNVSESKKTFTPGRFENFLETHGLTSRWSKPLLTLMDQNINANSKVTESQFCQGVHKLINMGPAEQAELIFNVASDAGMEQAISDVIECCIKYIFLTEQGKSWNFPSSNSKSNSYLESPCLYLLNDLKSFQKNKDDLPTINDVEKWITNSCHLSIILNFLIRFLFLGSRTSLFPQCVGFEETIPPDSLLDSGSILMLNLCLPFSFRLKWSLLFDSKLHGESFSRLVLSINKKGPCIIVILDDSDHVFGAFASHGLSLGHNFIGDAYCFLYSSQPNLSVYSATGYDHNFAYVNQNVKTLPNGIGFGGSVQSVANHTFGLYLDGQLKFGQSRHCSTFNSPKLSKTETFEVRRIQVWKVGQETPATDEVIIQSALDSNPDARVLLELSGKARHSDGYREPEQPN